MKLRDYLDDIHMTQAEFARQIGYNAPYINSVLRGVWKPGKDLMRAIEHWSKGKIKYDRYGVEIE